MRRIVEMSGLNWDTRCPWGNGSLGEALLTPTRIYVKGAVAAMRANALHGLAHITGGGLTENLPRALPEGLGAEIDLASWRLPPVFKWLVSQGGLEQSELLTTFNAGIGMVAIAPPEKVDTARHHFAEQGCEVFEIGRVIDGEAIIYNGSLS